MPVHIQQVTQI